MEKERSPAQLLQWVEQKLAEFSDWHDALRRALPPEGRHKAEDQLYSNWVTKKLFEEIRPLAEFVAAKWLFEEGVRVKPTLSNNSYDAVVILPEEGAFKVEITTTIDGQQAVIQREHMRKYGYAPAAREIEYQGTKKRGYTFQETPSEAVESRSLRLMEFFRIVERFEAKSRKLYPESAWLLIAFDDYVGFHSQRDVDELASLVELNIVPRLRTFSKLFLIGQSGWRFLEFHRR